MKRGFSSLTVAGAYIGTVVGAGFASGQEVLQFFGFFGSRGLLGLALATALFAVFGVLVGLAGNRVRATSHVDVIRAVGGSAIGPVIDAVVTFFLFGGFSAMAAGAGAVFAQQFGLNPLWGIALMVAASAATVLLGIEGVVTSISLVVPFLIASVLGVSLFTLLKTPPVLSWFQPQRAPVPFWPVSAVAYVSYNLLLAVSVLAPMGARTSRDNLRLGITLGAAGLGLGALAIDLAILTGVPRVARVEIPMILAAGRISPGVGLLYSVVLLAEIYTTAVGSLFGFSARLVDPGEERYVYVVIGASLVALVASQIGFSQLVSKLYSAVGYAGFLFLIALAADAFRRGSEK